MSCDYSQSSDSAPKVTMFAFANGEYDMVTYRANILTALYIGRCPMLCAFGLSARYRANKKRKRIYLVYLIFAHHALTAPASDKSDKSVSLKKIRLFRAFRVQKTLCVFASLRLNL